MRLLKLLAASALASEAHFLRRADDKKEDKPKEENPPAPDPAADTKKVACAAAVLQVCTQFKKDDTKDLKDKDSKKKDACKPIEDNCGKGKKGADVMPLPDEQMGGGVCAKGAIPGGETVSQKDAYKTADDFCHGSCGSC